MNEIKYKPIGVIHSAFKEPKGTPIQPRAAEGINGTVEVFPDYAEGLKDVEGFSHIILIYHFHLSKKGCLKVKPYMDNEPHGVFAMRGPSRPNPIGISTVRLVRINENIVHIRDVDIVDGTPLLDIKPYVPEFDIRKVDKTGWLEKNVHKLSTSKDDGRFVSMNSIFDRYYKKYDAWYDKNKFAYLSELEAIKKVLPNKSKGLEIGVGTGRFAHALGIKFGIDTSIEMLKIAKKRDINVRLGDGGHLPFKNDTFDYVAIIITICFVKNPQKVIEESNRVLKNSGKIIVGIVDKDSFLGKFYQEKKSVFYEQANFFSVEEVTDLLKKEGFKRFSYYQTIFKLPDEMNSIKNPQDGFGDGGFVVILGGKE